MRALSTFKTVLFAGVFCIAVFALAAGVQSCKKEKGDAITQQPVPKNAYGSATITRILTHRR
jgi:hypothetical protein